jgi:short-subunit dehydrogenase
MMAHPIRRNILVTGASSGLGEGMARLFAQRGRNLALCARRMDRLEILAAELRAQYPGISVVVKQLDVDDHDAVFQAMRECDEELGGLDRVIANAGLGKGAPIGSGRFRANKQTAETNFVGLLAQCEAAMELFRKRNAGHLVVMSSIAAERNTGGNVTTYSATKAAAKSLAEGIAMSQRGTPIRVTCLQPGYIESEMTARAAKTVLMVEAERGHHALVDAIERESAFPIVPVWPWGFVARFLRYAPAGIAHRIGG